MSPTPRIEEADENNEREEIVGLISDFGVLVYETVRVASGPPSINNRNKRRVVQLWNEFGQRLCDFAEKG